MQRVDYPNVHAHRALFVTDVVCLVLHEIRSDKLALSRAARCCQAFHGPSLDILWRDLESFIPLRNLLPGLIDERNQGVEKIGRPDEASLKRFQYYARRVRSWIPEKDGSDTAFCCSLASLYPGTNLFSSLRRLALFERIDPPQNFVLPPLLRRLELNHNYWRTSGIRPGEQYMAIVVAQAPFLQELFFYGPVPATSISTLIKLKNLQCLELGNAELPAGAMDTLASLPTLRTLELPDTGLGTLDIISNKGFHHLEALTITGRPWMIIPFLENVASTQLHSIMIHNSPLDLMPGTLTEWLKCFEKIKDKFKSCLRSFTVEAVGRLDGVTVPELLQPLMNLPDLEAVKIADLVHPSIHDIYTMTASWHNLKHFTLDTLPIRTNLAQEAQTDPSTVFGIHSLTFFAIHCPKLISLDLGIADVELPPIKSFPKPPLPHNLQSLRLQTPVVRDYAHLACIIDRVFPMLEEVKINDTFVQPPQDGESRFWLDVPELIKGLQATRKERPEW